MPGFQASRLLTKANVEAAVTEGTTKQLAQANLSAARTLEEFRRIGYLDVGDIFDDDGNLKNVKTCPPEIRAALASVEVVRRISRLVIRPRNGFIK